MGSVTCLPARIPSQLTDGEGTARQQCDRVGTLLKVLVLLQRVAAQGFPELKGTCSCAGALGEYSVR